MTNLFAISHLCQFLQVIRDLDIEKCADSRIGNVGEAGGISGGERRRLTVLFRLLCSFFAN